MGAAVAPVDPVRRLHAEAMQAERAGKPDAAARAYRRLLQLKPDHAETHNNLGRVLHLQGKPRDASQHFARSLMLMPQAFDQYASICATLISLMPPLGAAMRTAAQAWPQRPGIDTLFGPGEFDIVASDPLLVCVLQATPVRDVAFERLLTSLRAALLADAIAGKTASDSMLAFACALARQCFINEYVFATTPEEDAQAARLIGALDTGADIATFALAAAATYMPLSILPAAEQLLGRTWPPAVDDLLTQHLRDRAQERELRATMPRLTAIEDEVSQRVRQQYEENPYPRWVHVAGAVEAVPIDLYIRSLFPTTPFTPIGKSGPLDVLVAGCGTGWHAIGITQKLSDAAALAVDLSLASLAYAKRSTPDALKAQVNYAQADILKLDNIEQRFDVIDASGVLHHMADPWQGWRTLIGMLRPGGLMHLGLYSDAGRQDVVAARAFIAERGYDATPAEIRRCRQDLLQTPMRSLTRFTDFFTTSECRDLLFHVQETRVTIPAIKDFLAASGLRFLGFEFGAAPQQEHRALFSSSGWSLTDLDRWHALETAHPQLFSSMYHFWVQKD
ncbi:MAG TPA: methyltransferase domain-containing protein [Bradyrhizobium sp.]|jgi:SAM-dependent methyltransferase